MPSASKAKLADSILYTADFAIRRQRNGKKPVQPVRYHRDRTKSVLLFSIPKGLRGGLANILSFTVMLGELSFYDLPCSHEIGQHRLELPVAQFADAPDSGRLASYKSELSFRHVDSHPLRLRVQPSQAGG
jgi:hypothetical protein